MPTSNTQAQIAFKNLLGKSQTNTSFGIANEADGISFNITSNNIWLDTIYTSASQSLAQGTAVRIVASMSVIGSSGLRACYTLWPTLPPDGIDIKTGLSYSYGVGSLVNASAGSRVQNLVSDAYGSDYLVKPYVSTLGDIPDVDTNRDWVYQYNSGIYFQENAQSGASTTLPKFARVYAYVGNVLAGGSSTQNIRVTATGTNGYTSTTVSPSISTYSTNHLYLVDFGFANTSGTVSLNISNIGTNSVYKYGQSGITNLSPNDISVGRIYYLTYNSSYFTLYNSTPISLPSQFINPTPTLNSVGGIDKGTSFVNTTLQDVFSDLLYPEQLGNITSLTFSNTSFELGDTMSLATYSISWLLSNTSSFTASAIFEDVSSYSPSETFWNVGGIVSSSIGYTQNSYSFTSGTFSSSITRSRDFRFSLRRSNGTLISKTININWMPKVFYGTSTYSTLSNSQILNLSGSLATQSVGNWVIGGTVGYKYFIAPSTYPINNINYKGLPVALVEDVNYNLTNNGIGYQQISLTNSFGINSNYNIYRTVNIISGTFTITIN